MYMQLHSKDTGRTDIATYVQTVPIWASIFPRHNMYRYVQMLALLLMTINMVIHPIIETII